MLLAKMNLSLLKKWAGWLMNPETDLSVEVLKDCYGTWTDWERRVAPVRWTSVFWHSLKQVFPQVQEFFYAKLGNGSSFH